MKKVIIILIAFVCSITMSHLNAQSLCAGIKVESFPLNPQSGSYNYFGVRVTLDMTYDQNVTVTGYIYEEDYNTNNPFSVTVTAGNLSNETSATFFAAGPTAMDGRITISGVSPSTVTNNSVSFGTGCTNSEPIDRLNAIGTLHNAWMGYFLQYLIDHNTDLRDTSSVKSLIASQLNTFLTNNGFPTGSWPENVLGGADVFSYNSNDYSTAGAAILSSLQSLIDNYDPEDDDGFLSSLESLQSSALALSDPNEVYTVGLPVTIAMYSFTFGKNDAVDYVTTLGYQDSIRQLTAYVPMVIPRQNNTGADMGIDGFAFSEGAIFNQQEEPQEFQKYLRAAFNFNGKKAIASDAVGAVRGGIGGIAGGPAGIVAGALVGAAASSLTNMIGQAFSWLLFG